MSAPFGIERRDPCAPVLRLGAALAAARRDASTGVFEVIDGTRAHAIRVVGGAIADVSCDQGDRPAEPVSRRAARLFGLERPRVIWTPAAFAPGGARADADQVVLDGVRARCDLFDPVRLVDRIPVPALAIGPEKRSALARLPLADDERELLDRLRTPTPIPLILWKRGLDPRRAGALLVALNLVGAFADVWRPGLLPRLTAALRILARARDGATDRELLGACPDGEPADEDRAFRRISFELHPDRLRGLPAEERRLAEEAFGLVGAAYERLKLSRRRAAVGAPGAIGRVELVRRAPRDWAGMLEVARRCARENDLPRARAFALKALALSPPDGARAELVALLSGAA